MTQEMKPMTAKELEYVADSMSNEDLLMKQCAAAGVSMTNERLKQMCTQMINAHMQHYQVLLHMLEQHQGLAPNQSPS